MSERTPASSALTRFKVLDLTRVRAGPTCVRQLADWGADVIKVELPESQDSGAGTLGGPRHGPDFQNLHRNKRSMTLNLKAAEGREVFFKLIASADVVVENYRPDVKTRLGIDYQACRKVNPRIVYGSISGFGQDGPYVERPGVDQIAQGMGGLMSITGEPGRGPMRVGIPVADLCAGLLCAQGILVALLEREASGEGQWVQSSLLQAQIFMLDFQASRWTMGGEIAPQAGNDHPTSIPTGVFPTSDGHITIAAAGQHIFERFARAIGKPEWIDDPAYLTGELRSENRHQLNAAIAEATRHDNSQAWVDKLNAAGVPTGPINNIRQTFEDPQVRHLGIAETVDSPVLGPITLVGQAIKLSRTPSRIAVAPPEYGEHTDAVLAELGYSAAEIADLRRREVV
jgi:formyl-CoA transferase